MKTYQITVADEDNELLLQILKNLKIIKHFQVEDIEEFHQNWLNTSSEHFNKAYHDHEPDYTTVPLKEMNPNFQ
ncbi:MAG: hypothetical protein NW226_17090 [Microscillaceae bacterium]|nr:hypothetical protein [Microscillaceae bacterium]